MSEIAVWTTKEGQRIPIREMASSHLLSTIHFLERARFTNAVECARREPNTDPNSATMQYYLQWPEQYEALVAEAHRRNLISRGVTEAPLPRTRRLRA